VADQSGLEMTSNPQHIASERPRPVQPEAVRPGAAGSHDPAVPSHPKSVAARRDAALWRLFLKPKTPQTLSFRDIQAGLDTNAVTTSRTLRDWLDRGEVERVAGRKYRIGPRFAAACERIAAQLAVQADEQMNAFRRW
jgi:hypothetical protein